MALTQITYTNKETLNEQPSVADKNKVKADDMNEIKSVVNTNAGKVGDLSNLTTTAKTSIVESVNELKGGEIYSTNEVKTNKVWIDGKPIYRKVINTGEFSNTEISINTGITNINEVVNFGGSFKRKSSQTPYFYSIDNVLIDEWRINYNTGVITIKTNNQYVAMAYGYLILEYTKTTD
jgi:hypothetical protein